MPAEQLGTALHCLLHDSFVPAGVRIAGLPGNVRAYLLIDDVLMPGLRLQQAWKIMNRFEDPQSMSQEVAP